MIRQYNTVSLVAARDYRFHSGYEYLINANVGDDNWETLERAGGFKTKAAATKAGKHAAEKFLAEGLF